MQHQKAINSSSTNSFKRNLPQRARDIEEPQDARWHTELQKVRCLKQPHRARKDNQ